MFDPRKDHSCDPEENDIVRRHENVRRIEILKVFRFVRISEGAERPQRRTEPRIQNVFVLTKVLAAALRANGHVRFGNGLFSAVVAIPTGNTVSPPKLTGNTPVFDVLHPVEIDLLKPFRYKLRLVVLHHLDSGAGEFFHFEIPLFARFGFDRRMATVANTYVVRIGFDLLDVSLRLQVLDDLLSRFFARKSLVLACVFVHEPLVVDDGDERQIMTFAHFKVVGVVCRRDLHRARTEAHFHVVVRNHGNLPIGKGQIHLFAYDVCVLFVVRIDRHRRVAEHGFRSRRCDDHISASVYVGVFQMPQVARLFFVFHFRVGQRRAATGTPMRHTVAFIDQSFFVQVDEYFSDRFTALLVHRERFSRPVATRTEMFQLFDDPSAVDAFPFVRTL